MFTEQVQKETFTHKTHEYSVRDAIHNTLSSYFAHLGEQQPDNLYDMVLSEVELPMLESVMTHTRNNQSKAAKVLGLSRGTLRKLLKKYNFID